MNFNRKYFVTVILVLWAAIVMRSENFQYEKKDYKENLENGLNANNLNTLQLPRIFGSGMVLQQNTEVSIWGWAKVGSSISVVGSWGNSVNAITNSEGKWTAKLVTPKAISGQAPKYTLTIGDGEKSIIYSNVLVGEVWLLSGQSNMVVRHQPQVPNYQSDVDSAKYYPNIRFCVFGNDTCSIPKYDSGAFWVECTSYRMATDFSAVGYFFAKELYDHPALNIPIGLIQTPIGSTSIQSWIKADVFENDIQLKNYYLPNDSVSIQSYISHRYFTPSICYNGAISPIIPYKIKGVLWYQGESNVWLFSNPDLYTKALSALIQSWRNDFSNDFSFYSAQIAPFNYSSTDKKDLSYRMAYLREAQCNFSSLDKTGTVVSSDILLDSTELYNIHPYNKKTTGHRFALLALANDYGQNVQYLGPKYSSHTIDGNIVRISFIPESIGSGLATNNAMSPSCFKLAGINRKFYPALATIQENEIILSSPNVPIPVAVRYAFSDIAMTNFMNIEGIAAFPFRTDSWSQGSEIYADFPEVSVPIPINTKLIKMPTAFYNPISKKLTIAESENTIRRIEIIDNMGRILSNIENTNCIDLESLRNGIFVVKIYDVQKNFYVQKFVKY